MYQTEFLFFLSFPGGDKLPRTPYCVENKPVKHMVYSPTRVQKKSMNQPSSTRQQNEKHNCPPVPLTFTTAFETGGLVSIYFFLCIFFALLTYQNIVKQNLNIHRSEAIYHTHYTTVLPNKRSGQNLREGKKCGLFKFCKARFPSPGGSV